MRSFALVASLMGAAFAAPQLLDLAELEDIPLAPDAVVPVGGGSETITYVPAQAAANTYAEVLADVNDITPTRRVKRAAKPQLLDLAELEDIPLAPDAVVPVGGGSETITYVPAQAAANTYAEVLADVNDITPTKLRRSADTVLVARDDIPCTPLPVGYGPTEGAETPDLFLTNAEISAAANNAQTPNGWINTYRNEKGATTTQAYMGYSTYTSYNPAQCAADCSAIRGCISFNVFFERAPTINPGVGCPNPASTTLIKCSFWGTTIEKPSTTNTGQWRQDFQVVIAGSNGYRLGQPSYNLAGYTSTFLDNAAINAPTSCQSYMTVKTFNDGKPFDPSRCAASCKAESDYNNKYRPNSGTCQFFTTYLLLKNNVPQYQVCALYKSTWSPLYATNKGYTAASGKYTHQYVYSYSNQSNPGTDVCSASSSP